MRLLLFILFAIVFGLALTGLGVSVFCYVAYEPRHLDPRAQSPLRPDLEILLGNKVYLLDVTVRQSCYSFLLQDIEFERCFTSACCSYSG